MDKNAKSFFSVSLALLFAGIIAAYFVLASQATVSIAYPLDSAIYNSVVTELNFSAQFADSCTYSVDGGVTNLSAPSCGNLTGLSSTEGTNAWLVNAINDTDGNSTAVVIFTMDTIAPIAGATTSVNSTNVYGSWLGCSAENINITAQFTDNVSGINATSCRWKDRSGDAEGQWHSNNVTWNGNSTNGYCVAITGTSTVEQDYNLNLQMKDNAGNLVNATLFNGNTDCTPPSTADDESGIWHGSSYSITLIPSDAKSGVKYTNYSIDGSANATGTSVSINTDGNHSVLFYTVDNVGNMESAQSVYAALDTANPEVHSISVLDQDNFFSSYDSIVDLEVNITDISALTVIANFSALDDTLCSGDGTVELVYGASTGLYNGSCDLSSAALSAITTPTPLTIVITSNDSVPGHVVVNTTTVVLQNLDVPSTGGGCMRFGSDSTNFTEVLDFANVNFVVDMEVNLSCYTLGLLDLPDFRDGMLMNITSVDLSTAESAGKLGQLFDNMEITINGPNSFGNSRIYVNSTFFQELNTSATIKFFGLPFASDPSVIIDADAAGVDGTPIWESNGPDAEYGGVSSGNLTFSVLGFSGYDVGDEAAPIITVNSPSIDTNDNTPFVNITVNGTGTEPSQVLISGLGSDVYVYNSTDNTANCTAIAPGSDTFECAFSVPTPLADNLYNSMQIDAWDYGGAAPGNTLNEIVPQFTIDTAAPLIPEESLVEQTSNGTSYVSGFIYTFISEPTDSGVGIGSVLLNFSGTLYEGVEAFSYDAEVVDLAAGTYSYYWIVNDTLGNENQSAVHSYTILQEQPSLQLYLNHTEEDMAITLGEVIAVNATMPAEHGDINLYIDGALVNTGTLAIMNDTNFSTAGLFNVTATTAGNENYSSSSATLWVNVAGENEEVAENETIEIGENTTKIIVPVNLNMSDITANSSTNETEAIEIDFSLDEVEGNVTIDDDLNMSRETDDANYSIEFDAGTVISGGAAWNGVIILPTVNTSSFSSSAGSVAVVIDMGSSTELNFSSAVKIILTGMAGKTAAWSRGDTTLTTISTVCDSATAPTNIDAVTTRECYKDSGSDLVIWTFHFTSFGAVTPTATSTGGSGSRTYAPLGENATAVATPTTCTTGWKCDDWSACALGSQTRRCYKAISYCDADSAKPAETQSCTPTSTETARESIGKEIAQTVKASAQGWGFWTIAAVVLIGAWALYHFIPRKKK